jgi:hypothetical protein
MPRNVRNFWITGSIDGRKSSFASGPVRRDGGFELTVKMRDRGGIITAVDLRGYAENEKLLLWVQDKNGNELNVETRR